MGPPPGRPGSTDPYPAGSAHPVAHLSRLAGRPVPSIPAPIPRGFSQPALIPHPSPLRPYCAHFPLLPALPRFQPNLRAASLLLTTPAASPLLTPPLGPSSMVKSFWGASTWGPQRDPSRGGIGWGATQCKDLTRRRPMEGAAYSGGAVVPPGAGCSKRLFPKTAPGARGVLAAGSLPEVLVATWIRVWGIGNICFIGCLEDCGKLQVVFL